MSSYQWVCRRCGRRDDFQLLGMGFIICEGCGACHLVQSDNSLIYVPGNAPNFARLLKVARADEAER